MFTIEQIKTAHSNVKSGADFPAYIQDLKKLGVTHYETFVSDGHTDFSGENNYAISSPAKYKKLEVATNSNPEQFVSDLKAHQQGLSDYQTFCRQSAEHGVEKWVVDLTKMTCIYFDRSKNELLVEKIPC